MRTQNSSTVFNKLIIKILIRRDSFQLHKSLSSSHIDEIITLIVYVLKKEGRN